MLGFFKNKKSLKTPPESKQDDATPSDTTEASSKSWLNKLSGGLKKTRLKFSKGLGNLFLGKKAIDPEILEQLEMQLLSADVGLEATAKIISALTEAVSRKQLNDTTALRDALSAELYNILKPCEQPLNFECSDQPFVTLMIGVNGTGKTTTIGKLSHYLQEAGKSVMLAAGDTFRAAAVEQLKVWGERNNVPVIAQHTGADSASVLFDALQAAQARNIDVLIADTAGRLHTQDNLMQELQKIKRVLQKQNPNAPHEVLLVLDASIGQNALIQAEKFNQALGVTGIALTKLDGTAKGGIIFAIANKFELPIRFIGVGEGINDLRPFDAEQFIQALLADDQQ